MSTINCIINSELIPISKASVSVNDLGLQRGYGIFDYFKILDNTPVFLDDHLNRFYRSAESMRLTLKYSDVELKDQIHELMNINKMPVSGIKLTLTGGDSDDGFSLGSPNLIITQSPLPSYQPKGYVTGIKIVTHQHQRQMPGVKSIDYLMAVWLQPFIKQHNAQDVLYHNNNLITECPRANIFIVTKEEKVLTPAVNVLQGIIRSKVLSLEVPFTITEAGITLDDVYDAEEIFVTSTTKNILPVIQVDNHQVGDGTPGRITQIIAEGLLTIINKNPSSSSIMVS